MGPFGQRMQREREMRGITLDEIAEATKITTRCLRAIEEEDFSKLPGGIFNKGFVRSYARYIGIDEEEAVADFLAASGDVEPPLPTPAEVRGPVPSPALPNPKALATLGVLVLLVLGLWQLYPVAKNLVLRAWADVTQPPTVSANRSTTHQEPVSSPAPSAPASDTPASATQDAVPESAPVVEEPPAEPTQTAASEAPATPAPSPTVTPPAAPAAVPDSSSPPVRRDFVVAIRARKDSWISIVADGRVQSEGMMTAPSLRSVRAHNQVVLKMGNAGGLELSHNGRVLPPMGGDNQVTTLVFTAEGVQQ